MQVISSFDSLRTSVSRVGLILCGLLCLAGATIPIEASAEPSVGDLAPDFVFEGTDGQLHLLSEHRGKRGVVVAWFPKAFTPG